MKPRRIRIIGPHELVVNGEIVRIKDKIAQIHLDADEQLLMIHFNVRTRGNVPDYILGEYLSRFFSWKVIKIELRSADAFVRNIHFNDQTYQATAYMPYSLKEDLKAHVLATENFEEAYKFLTRGYQEALGALQYNETLLDRVTNMTLSDNEKMFTFGCTGDCQPNLSYAYPWTMLQEFIDHFTAHKVQIQIGVCKKTVKPETEDVTVQLRESVERPTGKMRTVSSCS